MRFFEWISDNKGKAISFFIVLGYYLFCFVMGDIDFATETLLINVIPLGIIWFGNELGSRWQPPNIYYPVMRPSPGSIVIFLGWIILFGFIGFSIYFHLNLGGEGPGI